jgi:hypothetical protein
MNKIGVLSLVPAISSEIDFTTLLINKDDVSQIVFTLCYLAHETTFSRQFPTALAKTCHSTVIEV